MNAETKSQEADCSGCGQPCRVAHVAIGWQCPRMDCRHWNTTSVVIDRLRASDCSTMLESQKDFGSSTRERRERQIGNLL